MSEQQAPTKKNAQTLCKMGCGFFGSGATGDCCSKCFMASLKKSAPAEEQVQGSTPRPASSAMSSVEPEPEPMEICDDVSTSTSTSTAPVETPASSPVAPMKKKKSKKTSYKKMMASMMTAHGEKDVQQEREALSKGLGGGAFTKVEKI